MSEESGGNDRPLTGKQKAFVEAYALCLNATHAARLAKYDGDAASLGVIGHENLKKVKIRKAIDELLEAQGIMPRNEVLGHFTDIARSDIADVLNELGGVDMLEAVKRGKSHLVRRIKTKTTIYDGGENDESREVHETEVEMYSRDNALEKLGRFYGLFTDKSEVNQTGDLKISIVRDDYRPSNPPSDTLPETD